MAKVINYEVDSVLYLDLRWKRNLPLQLALIDGRIFLPIAMFDDDEKHLLNRIRMTSDVEVYHREHEGGLVPCEWIQQQYPTLAPTLDQLQTLVRFLFGANKPSFNSR